MNIKYIHGKRNTFPSSCRCNNLVSMTGADTATSQYHVHIEDRHMVTFIPEFFLITLLHNGSAIVYEY